MTQKKRAGAEQSLCSPFYGGVILKNAYAVLGDTAVIYLKRKNGKCLKTFIDICDLEQAKRFPNTWCALWSRDTQSFYCYGKLVMPGGKRKSILLHRWLFNCDDFVEIDHIDNDTLNNCRKQNLRIVKHAQNHQNRLGSQRNSKSGIRGVSWNKRKRKWQVAIKVQDRRYFLGYFDSIEKAAQMAKDSRKRYMPFSKEALPR
ncbi:HNH endonuclease [Bacillaceae bacterium Marseille-Q3522]|nr:HNH endonuclease [Bacillaceae bacterium Marseille-Q3522]